MVLEAVVSPALGPDKLECSARSELVDWQSAGSSLSSVHPSQFYEQSKGLIS